MTKQKVPVSERAIIQRINRKLKPEQQKLLTARGFWANGFHYDDTNLGRFYIIDSNRNYLIDDHVDLEERARELGVLQPWEQLQSE